TGNIKRAVNIQQEAVRGEACGNDLIAQLVGLLDHGRLRCHCAISLLKMEPKAMAPIDFGPLAKWVGEWRKYGLIAGEGDRPACTSEARKAGEAPAITKRSRNAAETV